MIHTWNSDAVFTVIESPYSGDVEENVKYARRAVRHSLMLGEAPFASHLLYTQEGILDDTKNEERGMGIHIGWRVGEHANRVAFYVDRGWSFGMRAALRKWIPQAHKRPIVLRYIDAGLDGEEPLLRVDWKPMSNMPRHTVAPFAVPFLDDEAYRIVMNVLSSENR